MTEKDLPPGQILDESARIATTLLAIEQKADEAASAIRDRSKGIRAELGYTAVGSVDTDDLVDSRIKIKEPVITPETLGDALPLTAESAETTRQSREAITDILTRRDDRLLVIVGPCSIHDPKAAFEYAQNISQWRNEHGEDLEIVMRFYPEKPRTERDWKGFIYDPYLDDSDEINIGLVATRLLAGKITGIGVPLAMERLNALTPQYVNGLIAYDAIGARNTTDQKAREYASGTSSPVGFKNTPDGNIETAVEAAYTASGPHSFLGMGMNGTPHQIRTEGNPLAHIILRGGNRRPNYTKKYIDQAKESLSKKGLLVSIGVDASHENSGKIAKKQIEVVGDLSRQISAGENAIAMVMIESNLVAGKQKRKNDHGISKSFDELIYGQSITDECLDLDDTELLLGMLSRAVDLRSAARLQTQAY